MKRYPARAVVIPSIICLLVLQVFRQRNGLRELMIDSRTNTISEQRNTTRNGTFTGQNLGKHENASMFQKNIHERLSPVCRPTLPLHPIRRIVFGHMRKAGGTTITNYLFNTIKNAYPQIVEIVRAEGGLIEYPGTRNDTLYITHIRDPVKRAMTHFKYSGRWHCQKLVYKHKRPSPDWEPTSENAVPLENWIYKASGCQGSNFQTGRRLWD